MELEYRFATANDIENLMQISLDATESGRALYSKCGFKDSDECMVLVRDLNARHRVWLGQYEQERS